MSGDRVYATVRDGWEALAHQFIVHRQGERDVSYKRCMPGDTGDGMPGLYGGTQPHEGTFPPHGWDSGSRYYFGEDLTSLLGGG